MNHYERLKVSQDAPPEVIRAAYRALATKLHPDRQGADTGPDDVMHEQMAALNSAYEVLIDPKLRQDYDATLVHARPRLPDPHDSEAFQESGVQAASTRVDMDWLVPAPASSPFSWPPSKPVMLVGGSAVAVVVLAMAGFAWRLAGQQQVDRALSDQYATQPAEERQARLDAREPVVTADPRQQALVADAGADGSPKVAAAGKRRPTVDELSRMTDEELLKVLPALDGDTPAAPAATAATTSARGAAHGARHHPLDGKPLNLRTDTRLVDPLAPESPAGSKAKSRP